MSSFGLLSWACRATLFLILCLYTGTNNADEDKRLPIKMEGQVTKQQENNLYDLKMTMSSELRECMSVNSYLINLKGHRMNPEFYYRFTNCLCPDESKSVYWDVKFTEDTKIAVVTQAIWDSSYCDGALTVVPTTKNYTYATYTYKA